MESEQKFVIEDVEYTAQELFEKYNEKVIKYNFMFVYAFKHTAGKCVCGINDNFATNSSRSCSFGTSGA